MPKKFVKLKSADDMIVAYDDETGRLYKITMEPISIKSLPEDAIFEVAATVIPKKEPDAELKD